MYYYISQPLPGHGIPGLIHILSAHHSGSIQPGESESSDIEIDARTVKQVVVADYIK